VDERRETMGRGEIAKPRRIGWVNWILLTLFFIGIPSFVHADISDILLKFYPYITAQEEYSTNILLSTNRNKLDDWITTVTPGLQFSHLEAGRVGIDLDVNGGYNYYAKNNGFSYWSASGRLDSWYAVTPSLTFRLRDYLIRSDAARENVYNNQYNADGQYIGNTQPGQYLLSTVSGVQAIYLRNVVEPSMEYRFGKENLFSLLYRNNIYRNENPLFEDSMENTLNPKLTYWFDINNGVSLDYYLTWNTYQHSPDQLVNGVTPRYTYRFNPKTSIFAEFHFEYEDFKSPGVDYYVYNPSLGIEYKFSPTLTGLAQGGYWWNIPKGGSKSEGPFFDLSLTQRAARTLYTLAFQGGYEEDYITAQNLGFTKHYRGYGTINHQFTGRLSGQLTGSMERVWYSAEADNRKDWIWDARVGASYELFQWLTVALEGSYRGANSNISIRDYTEFSGLFRITVARPGYQRGMMGQPTSRNL
jgi:hypothetical protein